MRAALESSRPLRRRSQQRQLRRDRVVGGFLAGRAGAVDGVEPGAGRGGALVLRFGQQRTQIAHSGLHGADRLALGRALLGGQRPRQGVRVGRGAAALQQQKRRAAHPPAQPGPAEYDQKRHHHNRFPLGLFPCSIPQKARALQSSGRPAAGRRVVFGTVVL